MVQCNICAKSLDTKRALNGHSKVHKSDYEEIKVKQIENLLNANVEKHRAAVAKYMQSSNYCLRCGRLLTYEQSQLKIIKYCSRECYQPITSISKISKEEYDHCAARCGFCKSPLPYEKFTLNSKFCNRNCSNKYNSVKLKKPHTQERKVKISKSVSLFRRNNPTSTTNGTRIIQFENIAISYNCVLIPETVGPYTKLNKMTCRHCKKVFLSTRLFQYCPEHRYDREYRRHNYAFSFSIIDYLRLFNLSEEYFNLRGIGTPKNPLGLVRDHRISINAAILNSYDPYHISHPLNCELLTWHDNATKNIKSSILYTDLERQVRLFDLNNGVTVYIRPNCG